MGWIFDEWNSKIVILDADDPKVEDLNVQIDDIDKTYELECIVKLKSVTAMLTNGSTPTHQYLLELQEISKFQEESD